MNDSSLTPAMRSVLESATRLQHLVPDAVLVGGTASALYAQHRESRDHDHVLTDLAERYEDVLNAVEASEGWATSVRASRPPMTLLGSLDGIQAGLRQLRRHRPLEVTRVDIAPDISVTVPTEDEMLRIKAYLVIQRGHVRDYLDLAALADHVGLDHATDALLVIDDYYLDRSEEHGSVLTELILSLASPQPTDNIDDLASYRVRDERWKDFSDIRNICIDLSLRLGGAP